MFLAEKLSELAIARYASPQQLVRYSFSLALVYACNKNYIFKKQTSTADLLSYISYMVQLKPTQKPDPR